MLGYSLFEVWLFLIGPNHSRKLHTGVLLAGIISVVPVKVPVQYNDMVMSQMSTIKSQLLWKKLYFSIQLYWQRCSD